MTDQIVEVVSAVIVRDGRILLTQRRADKDFAFAWECPGGKVEVLEDFHSALWRELFEEVGLPVVEVDPEVVWTGTFENMVQRQDRATVRVSLHRVGILNQQPRPCEGQGLGWFTAEEMAGLHLAPANARALDLILACVLHGSTQEPPR